MLVQNGVTKIVTLESRINKPRDWGKIMIGVRLEKMIEVEFFSVWTALLTNGIRTGDKYGFARGMVAHRAANSLVRKFLQTDCDSIFFIDSDCDVDQDFLEKFRSVEDGWNYDVLQAFYLRRSWPPDAIWLKYDEQKILRKCLVLQEGYTDDVDVVGLHACLARREVFEAMLGDNDPETFNWFYYPREGFNTEDAMFSFDAKKAGFRLGATSAVKASHLVHLPIGWETYQEYLGTSGQREALYRFNEITHFMTQFTGESVDEIRNKAGRGSQYVKEAWEKYQPQTAEEIRQFYGRKDNGYLYDLLSWNTSQLYVQMTRPLENCVDEKVLVIGAGLGSEATLLCARNTVDIFEFSGVLRYFCKLRLGERVAFLDVGNVTEIDADGKYSMIVAIDTIEHVHPDEINGFLEAIDRLLKDGGVLYCHNNFKQQEIYPMHFDHKAVFDEFIAQHGYVKESDLTWRKPEKKEGET